MLHHYGRETANYPAVAERVSRTTQTRFVVIPWSVLSPASNYLVLNQLVGNKNKPVQSIQFVTKAIKDYIDAIVPMADDDFALLDTMVMPFALLKGGTLLEPGQVCNHIYFLSEGVFRMYYVDPDGREINYRFALENNFMVDFQSFLSRKPSRYYWQAMEKARGMAFSYSDVQRAYKQSRNWERFGRLIAEQVYQQVNERIELLQFLSPEQRYRHVVATQPNLVKRISQFHLSSYLGITPESLSRIRKRLSLH